MAQYMVYGYMVIHGAIYMLPTLEVFLHLLWVGPGLLILFLCLHSRIRALSE